MMIAAAQSSLYIFLDVVSSDTYRNISGVPARILFKNKDTDKLKSFSLIASADTGEIESGQG